MNRIGNKYFDLLFCMFLIYLTFQVHARRLGDFPNSSCLYFPAQQILLVSSYDGHLYTYDISITQYLNQITLADSGTSTANSSPKRDAVILSNTPNPSPKRGDAASGNISTLHAHREAITCMAWRLGLLFTGSLDGCVRVWNVASRPQYASGMTGAGYWRSCWRAEGMEGNLDSGGGTAEQTCSCAYVSTAKRNNCCQGGNIQYQELEDDCERKVPMLKQDNKVLVDSSCLRKDLKHGSPVTCISVSGCCGEEDCGGLVVGLKDGNVVVWNLSNFVAPTHVLKLHTGEVTCIQWWTDDRNNSAFNNTQPRRINTTVFTPTNDYDFTSGNFGVDNTIDDAQPTDDWVLVSQEIPKDPRILSRHTSSISTESASGRPHPRCRKAQYLVSGGVDGHVVQVEASSGSVVINWHVKEPVTSLVFDGRMIIIGGRSGDIILKDVHSDNGSLLRVLAHPGKTMFSEFCLLRFSASSDYY